MRFFTVFIPLPENPTPRIRSIIDFLMAAPDPANPGYMAALLAAQTRRSRGFASVPRNALAARSNAHPGDIILDDEEDDYADDDDYERTAAYNDMAAKGHQLFGTGAKAVTSATTATAAAAMSSTNELCLYRMDTCDPHCTKNCTSCKPRWSNLPSPEAEKAHIAQMENQHGIVKRIHPKDDNKTVRIDVQNKHMKGILASVFDGYPGFHASLLPEDSAWVFNEPFDMFVSRWDQLREYKLRTTFSTEKAAWVALVAAMTPVVQPTLDAIKRIRDTGLVILEGSVVDLPSWQADHRRGPRHGPICRPCAGRKHRYRPQNSSASSSTQVRVC